MNELHEQIERKFVESFDVSDWEVETDSGWVNIEKSNKTIEYDVWRLETENGHWLECADNHIVFIPLQSKMVPTTPSLVFDKEEVFVKDLNIGDEIIVNSDNKYGFDIDIVKSVTKLDRKEHMYDLSVGGEHTYYTNNILSHNTLILSNTAINAVKSGKNVLYISFEIDKRELRRRMDACFTDLSIKHLVDMREEVKTRVREAKANKGAGRFIIQEFPPSSVTSLDIEHYIHQLQMKKDFKPDVVILDYLGIMKPINKSTNKNSNERGKEVCEELRTLSDTIKAPILSAVQANRDAYSQNNVDMSNIADSIAIAQTCDLIISLAQDDEMKINKQIKFEVIKSRISAKGGKGLVDISFDKMKLTSEEDIIRATTKTLSSITETNSAPRKSISETKKKQIT